MRQFPWRTAEVAGSIVAILLIVIETVSAQNVLVKSESGVSVEVIPAEGRYEVRYDDTHWHFGGRAALQVGSVRSANGTDGIGDYRELTFNLAAGGNTVAYIRIYNAVPVVVFDLASIDRVDAASFKFPDFDGIPHDLHHFSYQDEVFSPCVFTLTQTSSPWLLYDDSLNAAIISPADDFFVSKMSGDGNTEIASGLSATLGKLPAGFSHRTMMVFGHGINRTWDTWGHALTQMNGKRRPTNEADPGLRYLGYWTDNGATYYYNYDSTLGYARTLETLVRKYRDEQIPIRYIQLDSWWYRKSFTNPDGSIGSTKNVRFPKGEWNRYGGIMKYTADTTLFPQGLDYFQEQIGLPLITHSRWMDPSSPYHREYNIAGFAVVDPGWWNMTMNYLSSADVTCYEQDWLSEITKHSPIVDSIGIGEAFTDGMAHAAKSRGMSIQYCMPYPSFFLQGSYYDNLTTIRVSDDRFDRSRWRNFLFTSRFASALGIWPWSDVFMSDERDNLLLCTLSAGMVGVGDSIGQENRANLLKTVRADGVIVKPDEPIVPSDETYLSVAKDQDSPIIAWTYSDHEAFRTVYAFAYSTKAGRQDIEFRPSSFGLSGKVMVYDTRSGTAKTQGATALSRHSLGQNETGYYIITPVNRSGVAFFGDKDKFVTCGRNRIPDIEECRGTLSVKITIAARETSVTLFGYSQRKPRPRSIIGSIADASYDQKTGRFEMTIKPGDELNLEKPGGDETKHALVEIMAQ